MSSIVICCNNVLAKPKDCPNISFGMLWIRVGAFKFLYKNPYGFKICTQEVEGFQPSPNQSPLHPFRALSNETQRETITNKINMSTCTKPFLTQHNPFCTRTIKRGYCFQYFFDSFLTTKFHKQYIKNCNFDTSNVQKLRFWTLS